MDCIIGSKGEADLTRGILDCLNIPSQFIHRTNTAYVDYLFCRSEIVINSEIMVENKRQNLTYLVIQGNSRYHQEEQCPVADVALKKLVGLTKNGFAKKCSTIRYRCVCRLTWYLVLLFCPAAYLHVLVSRTEHRRRHGLVRGIADAGNRNLGRIRVNIKEF